MILIPSSPPSFPRSKPSSTVFPHVISVSYALQSGSNGVLSYRRPSQQQQQQQQQQRLTPPPSHLPLYPPPVMMPGVPLGVSPLTPEAASTTTTDDDDDVVVRRDSPPAYMGYGGSNSRVGVVAPRRVVSRRHLHQSSVSFLGVRLHRFPALKEEPEEEEKKEKKLLHKRPAAETLRAAALLAGARREEVPAKVRPGKWRRLDEGGGSGKPMSLLSFKSLSPLQWWSADDIVWLRACPAYSY